MGCIVEGEAEARHHPLSCAGFTRTRSALAASPPTPAASGGPARHFPPRRAAAFGSARAACPLSPAHVGRAGRRRLPLRAPGRRDVGRPRRPRTPAPLRYGRARQGREQLGWPQRVAGAAPPARFPPADGERCSSAGVPVEEPPSRRRGGLPASCGAARQGLRR